MFIDIGDTKSQKTTIEHNLRFLGNLQLYQALVIP